MCAGLRRHAAALPTVPAAKASSKRPAASLAILHWGLRAWCWFMVALEPQSSALRLYDRGAVPLLALRPADLEACQLRPPHVVRDYRRDILCRGKCGCVATSTKTTAADRMPTGAHLRAQRTGPKSRMSSRSTPKQPVPKERRRTSMSAVTSTQSTLPRSTRTQAQNTAPSRTTTCPMSACPSTWVEGRVSGRTHRQALSFHSWGACSLYHCCSSPMRCSDTKMTSNKPLGASGKQSSVCRIRLSSSPA